jgi:hypothetical protein
LQLLLVKCAPVCCAHRVGE